MLIVNAGCWEAKCKVYADPYPQLIPRQIGKDASLPAEQETERNWMLRTAQFPRNTDVPSADENYGEEQGEKIHQW